MSRRTGSSGDPGGAEPTTLAQAEQSSEKAQSVSMATGTARDTVLELRAQFDAQLLLSRELTAHLDGMLNRAAQLRDVLEQALQTRAAASTDRRKTRAGGAGAPSLSAASQGSDGGAASMGALAGIKRRRSDTVGEAYSPAQDGGLVGVTGPEEGVAVKRQAIGSPVPGPSPFMPSAPPVPAAWPQPLGGAAAGEAPPLDQTLQPRLSCGLGTGPGAAPADPVLSGANSAGKSMCSAASNSSGSGGSGKVQIQPPPALLPQPAPQPQGQAHAQPCLPPLPAVPAWGSAAAGNCAAVTQAQQQQQLLQLQHLSTLAVPPSTATGGAEGKEVSRPPPQPQTPSKRASASTQQAAKQAPSTSRKPKPSSKQQLKLQQAALQAQIHQQQLDQLLQLQRLQAQQQQLLQQQQQQLLRHRAQEAALRHQQAARCSSSGQAQSGPAPGPAQAPAGPVDGLAAVAFLSPPPLPGASSPVKPGIAALLPAGPLPTLTSAMPPPASAPLSLARINGGLGPNAALAVRPFTGVHMGMVADGIATRSLATGPVSAAAPALAPAAVGAAAPMALSSFFGEAVGGAGGTASAAAIGAAHAAAAAVAARAAAAAPGPGPGVALSPACSGGFPLAAAPCALVPASSAGAPSCSAGGRYSAGPSPNPAASPGPAPSPGLQPSPMLPSGPASTSVSSLGPTPTLSGGVCSTGAACAPAAAHASVSSVTGAAVPATVGLVGAPLGLGLGIGAGARAGAAAGAVAGPGVGQILPGPVALGLAAQLVQLAQLQVKAAGGQPGAIVTPQQMQAVQHLLQQYLLQQHLLQQSQSKQQQQ